MKRRQFINRTLWFSMGAGLTAACGDRNASPQGRRPEVLRFSVTDLQGMEPLKRDFEAFAQALENILSLPVELVPLDSFVAAAPALIDRKTDLVLAGPSEYLLLNARAQGIPIIAVTRPRYRSKIMVRANHALKTVQDLKGKVVGMRTEGSTAGHIGASQLLADAGVDPVQDVTVRMVGDRGLTALLSGEIDAWADSLNRTTKFINQTPDAASQVVTLVEGPPLPSDVFVASPSLHSDFLQILGETLLTQQNVFLKAILQGPANDRYSDSEFVTASDGDYDPIRATYRTLGLEALIQ